jgi:hypothetical protein
VVNRFLELPPPWNRELRLVGYHLPMFAVPLAENPFAILTAIVAPAVLTNACSVLALGTSNRIARVVDRTRAVTAELGRSGENVAIRQHLEHQLQVLRVRARLLVNALGLAYSALGGFAISALIAIIGGALVYFGIAPGYRIAAMAGLLIGVAAVAALSVACTMMARETRMAIDNLHEEADLYAEVRKSHEK